MPRPKIRRLLSCRPSCFCFKPRGIPSRQLKEIILKHEELEALKLHEVDGLNQEESAQKMGISQPTFHRILASAYQKTATALVKGHLIRIRET
jgi:uncharacterized protein